MQSDHNLYGNCTFKSEMIMSEMCFRKQQQQQKTPAEIFLGLDIWCEKQKGLSLPSGNISTLLFKK